MVRAGKLLASALPLLGASAAAADDQKPLRLNMTALTGRANISVFECWSLAAPFATSDVPGVAGTQTLNVAPAAENVTYTILPARFDGGRHNAPVKQFVWYISGLSHLTLPNATDEAWVQGGKYGLIFADDTADVSGWGHVTRYPGTDQTVALTVPVADGKAPDHDVLHDGPCSLGEISGV